MAYAGYTYNLFNSEIDRFQILYWININVSKITLRPSTFCVPSRKKNYCLFVTVNRMLIFGNELKNPDFILILF